MRRRPPPHDHSPTYLYRHATTADRRRRFSNRRPPATGQRSGPQRRLPLRVRDALRRRASARVRAARTPDGRVACAHGLGAESSALIAHQLLSRPHGHPLSSCTGATGQHIPLRRPCPPPPRASNGFATGSGTAHAFGSANELADHLPMRPHDDLGPPPLRRDVPPNHRGGSPRRRTVVRRRRLSHR
jgi:hypothetical protein